MWKHVKVTDALFRNELVLAKRDFPFCLEDMEKDGGLSLALVRHRVSNQLLGITRRAGDYIAENFDSASFAEAQFRFNHLVDSLGNYVTGIVDEMRERTAELDNETLHGMETPIIRMVKRTRKKKNEQKE